jgi:hypothetical protein
MDRQRDRAAAVRRHRGEGPKHRFLLAEGTASDALEFVARFLTRSLEPETIQNA